MKPEVSNFADIIKSTFTLIKTTFQNSLIVKGSHIVEMQFLF